MKLIIAFWMLVLTFALHAAGAATAKPNILIFCADDLGYGELGCYGMKEVSTPNINSIAANGIRFTSGYVSAPLCSPSRAGLMAGRYQQRFGHENNLMTSEGGMPLAETTLGQRMKALGYATTIVGKWHLGKGDEHLPMKRGFDEYFGVFGNPGSYFTPKGFIDSRESSKSIPVADKDFYTTDAFAVRAGNWIEQHKDGPWFLFLPFNAVHAPHEASEKYLERFKQIKNPRRQRFDAMLSAMDDAVGVVLGKLRELKLEENTLIFFISDNGAPANREGNGVLRGGKHTCWEGGTRLPWMVQWKGKLPAGKVDDRPVVQLDVMPTCVAAAGGAVDPMWKLDGVNLLPYLSGKNEERPHQTLHWRIDGMWAVRHGDMKLVHGEANNDPPELYDLATDIGEKNNLATKQPEKVKTLKDLWDQWNSQMPIASKSKRKAEDD
ncbi:sulfatase-like hydrolase/transferase [Anatilimnocola floriformis]|uniref:sulfatase-like hydrolase/transferase n=1 Tax=Anatilimnocola floriformis TaxID=2948575 RepID=UPI0020C2F44D|nr:sulfatase-like hydrolase/transferase [Anatilimnocola floriformis]